MPDIKIQYTKAKDYRIIPVTGAWGGMSPQGEIIFDLWVEKRDVVHSVTLRIEQGKPPQEIETALPESVREAQIGIVVRPDIAYSLGKWLMEKAKEAGFIEGGEGHA